MSEVAKSSKKFAKISIKRRNQLIELVLKQNKGVAQAAKRLNIKLSTAKHIIKTYEEKGYLYNKKMHKKQSHQDSKEEYSEEKPPVVDTSGIKKDNHDQVKVETKQEGPQELCQLPKTQNLQGIYPLSQFACIPFFLFYSNNKY